MAGLAAGYAGADSEHDRIRGGRAGLNDFDVAAYVDEANDGGCQDFFAVHQASCQYSFKQLVKILRLLIDWPQYSIPGLSATLF